MCSVAKGSFSNFISTLYPKVFMLCKKKEYNGLILRPKDHHHQKNFYHGNNLNQNFQVSRFYLAVLWFCFVANVASFAFKSEILDSSTISF